MTDDGWLAGKRALVTGAASGIGLAVAHRLVAAGCEVTMTDVERIDVAELIGPHPGQRVARNGAGSARACQADLADREAVAELVRCAGQVDILVNNAGLQHVSPIESFPDDRWDLLLSVMITAPFLLTRAVLPGMYQAGWGRIINISSVHGLVASPFKSAYVTAKHALLGLTKVVALEAAARSPAVTAHAICPSYVRTPLVEAQISDQARAHGIDEAQVLERIMLAPNAIRRLIEPAEVADAVAYLCRPTAWTMSGSALTLDAGWLAH
jgi:3-hydroxybutyrate dehydrogenase